MAGGSSVNGLQQSSRKIFGTGAWLVAFALVLATAPAHATDFVIYDDALENGFSTADSYPDGDSGVFVGSTVHAHSGTKSIAFTGNGGMDAFNALSFIGPMSYSTDDYPVLHFWIYGSSPGGQNLQIQIYADRDSGTVSAQAPLDQFISGGAVGNGVWREVTIPITAAPISYSGLIDRIDIQSESSSAQSTVYIDDVSLQSAVVDPIFADGFEAGTVSPPPPNGLVNDQITYDTFASDRFTWYDSAGKQRVAVLAHNDSTSYAGSHGGELREFIYQAGGSARTVVAPARGDGGFGYIVSHPGTDCAGAGDTSTLGHEIAGSWTRVFVGRHHAIFRFQQNYPRYCNADGVPVENDIPIVIDWVFSTGLDDPLWAVTYDMHLIGANVLDDDSRSPYGTMFIDGSNVDGNNGAYMDSNVGGIRWGDEYEFATTGDPATLSNGWNWPVPSVPPPNKKNLIPFIELWASGVDATMGLVQTQTIAQQDAGGGRNPGYYDVSAYWNTTSANGQACPDKSVDQGPGKAHSLPCVGSWPYQANSFSYGTISDPVNDAKMTWGTQYGFLGQSAYPLNDRTLPTGSTASGYPYKSYSVFVVLGVHSAAPVDAETARATALSKMSVTATTGSVATAGPGAGGDNTITYVPSGFDPVYGAIVFNAAGNNVSASITVDSTSPNPPLKHPLIVVKSYTAGTYPTVTLGGTVLTPDVDYFASLRSSPSELWITLNKTLTGTTSLQITH